MTLQELLNLDGLDVLNMSRKELSQAVQTAGRTLNRRMANLEKNDLTTFSPAYKTLATQQGGRPGFKARGKSTDELREEVLMMRDYASKRTSTVSGAKRNKGITMEILKTAQSRSDHPISSDEAHTAISAFWDDFRRLREALWALYISVGGETVLKDYREEYKKGTSLEDIITKLNTKYKKQQYEQELFDSIEEPDDDIFFTI